jgi:hypothetical protein
MKSPVRVLLAVSALACAIAGCASKGPQDPYADWEQYRQKVWHERLEGKIPPSEAQIELRDEYRRRFGLDPEAAGFYAFSISLLQSAERGYFPLDEADVMIRAKEAQMVATRAALVRVPRPEVNDASQ